MSLRGGVNGRVWRESVWFWFYARTNYGFWRNPALNTAYVQTPLQKRIMAEYHNMCYFLLFVYRIHLICGGTDCDGMCGHLNETFLLLSLCVPL